MMKNYTRMKKNVHELRSSFQFIIKFCEAGRALNAMFGLLYSSPAKVMIIGEGCSIACEPCSDASMEWNITSISYSCSSNTLSNKDRFPRFFRTSQSGILINPSRIELMRLHGWERVALLKQSYDHITVMIDDMVSKMESMNWTAITTEIVQKGGDLQVANLKRHDARIIFGATYEDKFVEICCKMYQLDHYGPKIQWILPDWYSYYWWKNSEDCTDEQMLQVADGAIYTGIQNRNPKLETSIGGLNVAEFDEIFYARVNTSKILGDDYAPLVYDAIWAAALVLNTTIQKMAQLDYNKTLDEFIYSDVDILDLVLQSFHEIEFVGVRGYTKFDESGDPSGSIMISQQQGERVVQVGLYHPQTKSHGSHIEWVNGGLKWRGGHPPRDGSVTILKQAELSKALYLVMCLLAALGVLLALAFLAFNTIFRDRRIIKMSSPRINNLILCGCMLTYLTIFFYSADISLILAFCIVRQVTFACGFAIVFGSLFAKTWRVHVIMITSMKTAKSKVIKDSQLALMVLLLVLINSSILVLWQATDPLKAKLVNVTEEVSASDPDIIYKYEMPVCESSNQLYFTSALLAIQGLLLIFGAFLAWETRKVKVEALNDSKYIGMCIYNVVLLAIMGVAIHFVVDGTINISFAFMSSFIIAGTTLTQMLIFVPKVLAVHQNIDAVGPTSGVTQNTQSNTQNSQAM